MSETTLRDIGLYKNRFVNLLLNSPDFCETIIQSKNYTEDDVDNLVYSQIFPYLYVDDTQTDVLPYVCFEVNIPRIPTNTIKNAQLIVWVYCHKKCMKYSKKGFLGTRADILADIVERQLHESTKFGIKAPSLQSVRYFFPQKEYYGHELIFNISDFKVKQMEDKT